MRQPLQSLSPGTISSFKVVICFVGHTHRCWICNNNSFSEEIFFLKMREANINWRAIFGLD